MMRWRLSLAAIFGVASIGAAIVGVFFPGQISTVRTLADVLTNFDVTLVVVGILTAYGSWAIISRKWIAAAKTQIGAKETDETVAQAESDNQRLDKASVTKPESASTPPEDEFTLFGVTLFKFGDTTTHAKVDAMAQTDGSKAATADSSEQKETNSSEEFAETYEDILSTKPEGEPMSEQMQVVSDTELTSVSPDVFDKLRHRPPENVQQTTESFIGTDFEDLVRDAKAEASGENPYKVERLTTTLRDLLADLELQKGNAEAEKDIETGEWTENRAAAAFLSGSKSVSPPFLRRLLGWLDPETEVEFAVGRTLSEIDDEHGETDDQS